MLTKIPISDFILLQQNMFHAVLRRPKCMSEWGKKRDANLNEEKGKKKIDINIKSGHVWERQRSAKCSI